MSMRHLEVRVAYGTSKRTTTLHGGEFTIASTGNRAAYDMAGVKYDTKFDLMKTLSLPWDSTFCSSTQCNTWPDSEVRKPSLWHDEGR